jgi:hypothetical protein
MMNPEVSIHGHYTIPAAFACLTQLQDGRHLLQ